MSQELLSQAKEPKEVADIHLKAIKEDDYDLFLATLTEEHQERAEFHLSAATTFWRSACHYRNAYGVYWVFIDVVPKDPERATLRFQRKNRDGTNRGNLPAFLVMVKTAEGWRVDNATY